MECDQPQLSWTENCGSQHVFAGALTLVNDYTHSTGAATTTVDDRRSSRRIDRALGPAEP
jgi:hypothetical protein